MLIFAANFYGHVAVAVVEETHKRYAASLHIIRALCIPSLFVTISGRRHLSTNIYSISCILKDQSSTVEKREDQWFQCKCMYLIAKIKDVTLSIRSCLAGVWYIMHLLCIVTGMVNRYTMNSISEYCVVTFYQRNQFLEHDNCSCHAIETTLFLGWKRSEWLYYKQFSQSWKRFRYSAS